LPPVFRAPELLTLKKKYHESVDIWACGCIIFNMVTGIPPFYESDDSALKNLILHGKYNGYFPEFDRNATQPL
jgi:serine/threonine protein kinase